MARSRSSTGTVATNAAVVMHGWTLLAHPLFLEQLERLVAAAARERAAAGARAGPNTKLLAHILDLVLDKIPRAPGDAAYRHGGAIAGGHRDWFRAKTGNGRYRLFYRFHSPARIIVYAWVSDADSLCSYGARDDAYVVFARMLAAGNPPSSWDALEKAAEKAAQRGGLARVVGVARRTLGAARVDDSTG